MKRVAMLLVVWLLTGMLLSGCSVSIRKASVGPSNVTPSTASSAATPPPDPTVPGGTPTAIAAIPTPTVTPSPTPDPTNQPAPTTTSAGTTTPSTNPTPRPTQPAGPTPTPLPAATTPTPTPSNPPSCANIPVRGFGLLWNGNVSVARAIGCPDGGESGVNARVQMFDNGYMIWLQTGAGVVDQSDWVITVIDGTAARYRLPADLPEWDESATVPTGAFKWVWDNVYTDKALIGDATAPEYQTSAALQMFDTGTMVWLKDPPAGNSPAILVVRANLLSASRGSAELYPDLSYT